MTKRKPDTDTLPLTFDPPPRNKGGRPRLAAGPLTVTQRAKRYRDKRKAAPIEEQGTPELLRRLASGFRGLREAQDSNENNEARATMARIMRELARRHGVEF